MTTWIDLFTPGLIRTESPLTPHLLKMIRELRDHAARKTTKIPDAKLGVNALSGAAWAYLREAKGDPEAVRLLPYLIAMHLRDLHLVMEAEDVMRENREIRSAVDLPPFPTIVSELCLSNRIHGIGSLDAWAA